MQDQHLFEYAVIRVMPKVEREEFLNVGVVVYCASRKFLMAVCAADDARMSAFAPATDTAEIRRYLEAFVLICAGKCDTSPISKLPAPERFRWLTATRSTVIQTSKVHPGLAADPAAALERLFQQLVL